MTTAKTCTRCNGKGYGAWRMDGGRCFKCAGHGTVLPLRTFDVAVRVGSKVESYQTRALDEAAVLRELNGADSMYAGCPVVSIGAH